jgi:hypothetical protein
MNDLEKLRVKLSWLLNGWESGAASTAEVHQLAEQWMSESVWPQLERSNPLSAAAEVLSQLDILNQQLITPDDIPAMRQFIEDARENALSAWKRWEKYWESVDLEKRRQELAGSDFYAS